MILFHFIVSAQYRNEMERYQSLKPLKYFGILQPMNTDVRFAYVPWKNV